jgi:ketosteroid isomerase-like protein
MVCDNEDFYMDLELTPVIADFFSAEDRRDTEALCQCFAENAVVHDEGRNIKGHEAIREWQLETKRKYQHTTKPLASVQRDGKTIVSARLTGNFPGSPADLQFAFDVEAGKILALEIK